MNFNHHEFFEATCKKVNSRSEHHGEDKKLAMDAVFVAHMKAEVLKKLCVGDPPNFQEFFWTGKGEKRATGNTEIKNDRKFEDHKVSISFSPLRDHDDAQTFVAKAIDKFRYELESQGIVKLQFRVILHPTDEKDVGWLDKNLNEKGTVYLKFEAMQSDLADQADELSSRRSRRKNREPTPA